MDHKVLNKIRKIEWQYLVNRKETLLCQSLIDNSHDYLHKLTGINWVHKYVLRPANGDVLHSKKELEWIHDYWKKSSLKQIGDFRRRLVLNVSKFDKVAKAIEKIDCTKLSAKQLAEILDKYITHSLSACAFVNPFHDLDRVLSKRILDVLPATSESQKQAWLGTLTYPFKDNSHFFEELDLYELVKFHRKLDFYKSVNMHLQKYGWIGARGYWWNRVWNQQLILDRVKHFVESRKNPDKEIKNHLENKKHQKQAFEKLLKQLKITKNSETYKIIIIGKEFAYLRTWRTEVIYSAGYKARNMFYEIARRANFFPDDVIYLTFKEVKKMAQTKKRPMKNSDILKRKQSLASFMNSHQYYVFAGKAETKKVDEALAIKQEKGGEVRGNVAFSGKVRARVSVVFTGEDLKRFKKGDVLVAVMTFPNFVPAMEKASAFVTDEGGILCHAAIVSRELKKPCIIGTKIATKIFKDGDLVEVDANHGIVKILKRA